MDALDVRTFTVGPFQENCYIVREPGRASAAIADRPRRRGRAPDRGGRRRSASTIDGDPADPHAPRPHRRGRGARRAHRRAGLLPGARARRARRHRRGRTAPLGLGGFESYEADELLARRRAARARRPRRSTCIFTPGHSPGHLTYALPDARDAARRRRALPRLGRARRPPRRRLADAAGFDHEPARRATRRETLVLPGHGARTTLGERARHQPVPRPSSPPGEPASRPRAGPSTSCPSRRARARRARARPRASCSSRPATGGSRRRRSRRPSSSRAASARRPTSSRRRCTASTTAAGAR